MISITTHYQTEQSHHRIGIQTRSMMTRMVTCCLMDGKSNPTKPQQQSRQQFNNQRLWSMGCNGPSMIDSDLDGINDGEEDPDMDGLNRTGLVKKYCPGYNDSTNTE